MKEKSIGPFQVETVKLKLSATKAGSYTLNPEVTYVDDGGKTKAVSPNPITITVQPAKPAYEALPGRITTGYTELDKLLLGGIPEKYAVLLVAPSSDERQLLIKRFLAIGVKTGETTLYITSEPGSVQDLASQNQNLCIIDCSPQTDQPQQSLPNTYKLRGIENLTNIDITLTKYFRTLQPKQTASRRACIDILSDVLLEHHPVVTRKWLSSLLTNLKTKSFTTLAVINPRMHPQEEFEAILGVFDGEIRVSEKETPEGIKQTVKIKKLVNQKYSEKEIILNKEALSD
jgi:KaiC/GvpD/RAD55 family RecA-like ATPase